MFSSVLFFTANDVRVVFAVIGVAAFGVAVLCRWLPDVDRRGAHVVQPAVLEPVAIAGSGP